MREEQQAKEVFTRDELEQILVHDAMYNPEFEEVSQARHERDVAIGEVFKLSNMLSATRIELDLARAQIRHMRDAIREIID